MAAEVEAVFSGEAQTPTEIPVDPFDEAMTAIGELIRDARATLQRRINDLEIELQQARNGE